MTFKTFQSRITLKLGMLTRNFKGTDSLRPVHTKKNGPCQSLTSKNIKRLDV